MVIECKTQKIVDAFKNIFSQSYLPNKSKYLRDVATATRSILKDTLQLSNVYAYYSECPSRLVVEHNFEKDGIYYTQSATFYEEDFKYFIGNIMGDARYLAEIVYRDLEYKQHKSDLVDKRDDSKGETSDENS